LANWAEIKALVEEDACEKRNLIFSPGVSQGPGQWLTFQMLFQFTIMINKDVFLALRNPYIIFSHKLSQVITPDGCEYFEPVRETARSVDANENDEKNKKKNLFCILLQNE
jgi:hypothetical protein